MVILIDREVASGKSPFPLDFHEFDRLVIGSLWETRNWSYVLTTETIFRSLARWLSPDGPVQDIVGIGLVAIGNQSTEEIDHKVDRAAMSGVFNLRDIFELIDNGFDQGSFAQQEFIRNRQALIFGRKVRLSQSS